jgi:ABC-type transport system substrate-binding protein
MALQFQRSLLKVLTSKYIITIAFCLLSTFCFSQSGNTKKLRIAINTLPTNMDPTNIKFGHQVILFQSIYQTLVKIDTNGDIAPSVAKKWKVKDSMKTYIFELDKIKFHNGENLTADDVAFSISRLFWPQNKSLIKNLVKNLFITDNSNPLSSGDLLKSIKVINENTIKISLNKPYRGFLPLITTASFSIISKNEYLKYNHYYGSGAFYIKTKGEKKLELVRNPFYKSSKINNDFIEFHSFKDIYAAKKLAKNKSIDLIFLGLIDNSSLFKDKFQNYKLIKMNNPVFLHLFTNQNTPFLSKKENRKFLSKLVNKYGASSELRSWTQIPVKRLIPKGLLPLDYYKENNSKLKIEDSFKIDKQVSLNLLTTENLLSEGFFAGLKESLKKNKIILNITKLKRKDYVKNALNTKKYDLVVGAFAANYPDIDGIMYPITGTSGWTFGNYNKVIVSDGIKKYMYSQSNQERLNGYVKVLLKFEDESYVFPLYKDHIQILYNTNLTRPTTNYRYEGELWNLKWK